jgi:phosphoglycerate dehydrogenase-like enzyme
MADTLVWITEPFPDPSLERLRAVSSELKITAHPLRADDDPPEELLSQVEVLSTFEYLPDPEDTPHLKWVHFLSAGIDQHLDHPLLQSEVKITTSSGIAASQMAEAALAFSLALARRLPRLLNDKASKTWPEDRYARDQPRELRDSTVGVVGYGSVGREVARLFHNFGTTVLATKRDLKQLRDPGYMPEGLGDPDAELPKRLYPPEAVASMASLCEFLVVSVPLTAHTRGMIDVQVFEAMKPSAFLIDISRGGVTNHGDLISALNEKRLAGAALDVFPIEPLPESSPLWDMPNVLISPHIGGYSKSYFERATTLLAENLRRYVSELPLLNQFDPQHGY